MGESKMWAGANPRSLGPTLDDRYELDESEYVDALSMATYRDVRIMKAFGDQILRKTI